MFFLKIGANGFKKKNIIFIENFIDQLQKLRLRAMGLKVKYLTYMTLKTNYQMI